MWETKDQDGALLGFQDRSGDSVDGLAPIRVSNSEYAREHGWVFNFSPALGS